MKEDIEARERFLVKLEWLLALNNRYNNPIHYGIVHVSFSEAHHLGRTHGLRETVKMLASLTAKLRNAFRNTDLVARDVSDGWLLIPFTAPETVTDKILEIVEIASEDGLNIVDRDIAVFIVPDDGIHSETAKLSAAEFLSFLKQNREEYRWNRLGAQPA